LAERMSLSYRTIDTYFNEAMLVLNIHDRAGVVAHCIKKRWIGAKMPLTSKE
jgi:DNA-binding NarL/FixJ family response regulator